VLRDPLGGGIALLELSGENRLGNRGVLHEHGRRAGSDDEIPDKTLMMKSPAIQTPPWMNKMTGRSPRALPGFMRQSFTVWPSSEIVFSVMVTPWSATPRARCNAGFAPRRS
jgi:hypothetical protein